MLVNFTRHDTQDLNMFFEVIMAGFYLISPRCPSNIFTLVIYFSVGDVMTVKCGYCHILLYNVVRTPTPRDELQDKGHGKPLAKSA